MNPNTDISYGDLSPQELADEIAGLDKEIESCQASLAKLRRSLKQKEELRDSLVQIAAHLNTTKGWLKK